MIVGFEPRNDLLFRDDLARLFILTDGAPEGYQGNVGLVTKFIPGLRCAIPPRRRPLWLVRRP